MRLPGLQGRCTDMKAEVRELLSSHKIKNMRMVPVKRNYAFEHPSVAHGEQWLLKVRERYRQIAALTFVYCSHRMLAADPTMLQQ